MKNIYQVFEEIGIMIDFCQCWHLRSLAVSHKMGNIPCNLNISQRKRISFTKLLIGTGSWSQQRWPSLRGKSQECMVVAYNGIWNEHFH